MRLIPVCAHYGWNLHNEPLQTCLFPLPTALRPILPGKSFQQVRDVGISTLLYVFTEFDADWNVDIPRRIRLPT